MKMDNAEGSSCSDTELSHDEQAVLVGTLLGDGCLAMHGYNARLHIKHKVAHRALVEFKLGVFRRFISMNPHEFDQVLFGKRYPAIQFATRTSPVFTKWHDYFYRDRRKVVPNEIAELLCPLALAVWIMDDGAADHVGMTLQTHSFCEVEVKLPAKALSEKFSLCVTIRKNRGREVIYVPLAEMPKLWSIIEGHILPEFVYKLGSHRN